jgi:hypothetical protein
VADFEINIPASAVKLTQKGDKMAFNIGLNLTIGGQVTVSGGVSDSDTAVESDSSLATDKEVSFDLLGAVAGETKVVFGDGTEVVSTTGGTETLSATMPSTGKFVHVLSGPCERILVQGDTVTAISRLGDGHGLTRMDGAFDLRFGRLPNLAVIPAYVPNTIANFQQAFRECDVAEIDLSGWPTGITPSTIQNMFLGLSTTPVTFPPFEFGSSAVVVTASLPTKWNGNGLGNPDYGPLAASQVSGLLFPDTITTENYDAFLIQFDATSTITSGTITTNATYTAGSAAATARSNIIAKGVTISDGGSV